MSWSDMGCLRRGAHRLRRSIIATRSARERPPSSERCVARYNCAPQSAVSCSPHRRRLAFNRPLMLVFWSLAILLLAITLALLLPPLLRRHRLAPEPDSDAATIAVYRDQKRQ